MVFGKIGYMFLSCLGVQNNRELELLSMSVHKSPMKLKERVGNSRTYIRPMQCDLDTSPIEMKGDDDVVSF